MQNRSFAERDSVVRNRVSKIHQPQAHHSCASRGGKGGHRHPSSPVFRPSDPVPQSGIYEVVHDGDHRLAHDAVMIQGNLFPSCEVCKDKVRFRIVRTAPYIFQDEDFGEQS